MKTVGLTVCLAFALVSTMMGQQKSNETSAVSILPPTRAQVMRFMEVMQVRERTQSILQTEQEQVKTVTHDMLKKTRPDATPEQQARFEKVVESALTEIFANYPIDDVLRDMIPLYQSHFTESDLDQIIAFYSSPVGQKILREMPAMSSQAMRITYARLEPKIEAMMSNLQTHIQEMIESDKTQTGPNLESPHR